MQLISIPLFLAVLSLPFIPNTTHIEYEQPPIEISTPKTFDSEVSRLAKKYKQNEQLARNIITCEGIAYKNLGNNKNYLNGVLWSTDIGWWQINNYYHEKSANKLGLDIYNDWDNLEYGFILLSEQGVAPWSASKHCWSKKS